MSGRSAVRERNQSAITGAKRPSRLLARMTATFRGAVVADATGAGVMRSMQRDSYINQG